MQSENLINFEISERGFASKVSCKSSVTEKALIFTTNLIFMLF
jgi:hypothetical protein